MNSPEAISPVDLDLGPYPNSSAAIRLWAAMPENKRYLLNNVGMVSQAVYDSESVPSSLVANCKYLFDNNYRIIRDTKVANLLLETGVGLYSSSSGEKSGLVKTDCAMSDRSLASMVYGVGKTVFDAQELKNIDDWVRRLVLYTRSHDILYRDIYHAFTWLTRLDSAKWLGPFDDTSRPEVRGNTFREYGGGRQIFDFTQQHIRLGRGS